MYKDYPTTEEVETSRRAAMSDDIGRMSHGLRDNAKDLFDLWMHMPGRRADFGERELLDIREAYLGLGVLLREMDKLKKREAA